MGGLPCRLKALNNGRTIEHEAGLLSDQLEEGGAEFTEEAGYEIVECLNKAEDIMFQAKRLFLESQGFTGPWPHSMSKKGDKPHEY